MRSTGTSYWSVITIAFIFFSMCDLLFSIFYASKRIEHFGATAQENLPDKTGTNNLG
jgi:hypothetical protein